MSWERQTSEALHSCARPPARARPPPSARMRGCTGCARACSVGLFAQTIVAPVMRVMARMDTQVL